MKNLQLLIKPVSSECNLKCSYCFYEDVCSHRSQKTYGRMSQETLEAAVKKALRDAGETCVFGFQGGEPMLAGLSFFEEAVRLAGKYKKPCTSVRFVIQTNGTILDEPWIRFLRENHVLVGISLDGKKEFHDRNRRDATGGGTFSTVLNNSARLLKAGVEVNILSVLTRQSARKISSNYRFFLSEGFFYQQYIPCLGPLGKKRGELPWEMRPRDYAEALKTLFDLWFADICRGVPVSVRDFDNWMGILAGGLPEACALSGGCSMQYVVEAGGDVYPCDFYVLDEYRTANIHEDTFSFGGDCRNLSFFRNQPDRDAACGDCRWRPLCRGGCRRDYEMSPDGVMRNYFCEAYREFFSHSIGRMEWLLSRNGL